MLSRHRLNQPPGGRGHRAWLFLARELQAVSSQSKDRANISFITHPTRHLQAKYWNWFHTLAEQKAPVKSES